MSTDPSYVAAQTGLLQGRVAVGTIPSSGVRALPAVLAAFHTEHRGVELLLAGGDPAGA